MRAMIPKERFKIRVAQKPIPVAAPTAEVTRVVAIPVVVGIPQG